MFTIDYVASGFPAGMNSALDGNHSLQVTWQDIVWAAVSVGKMGFDDLLEHDRYSSYEILFRIFMVRAVLRGTANRIQRSPAYNNMDPSEKSSISYFLGMAMGKLVASKLLNTHWMVHWEKLCGRSGGLPGRSRPDLVGQDDKERWIICEAKGRSGGHDGQALRKAKEQVRQVRSVGGTLPFIRMATESYFTDYLRMQLVDPDNHAPEFVDLEIGKAEFQEVYYKPFQTVLEQPDATQKHQGEHYAFVHYPTLGARIGVWEGIRTLSDPRGILSLHGDEQPVPDVTTKSQDEGWSYSWYMDGLAIGLDSFWMP